MSNLELISVAKPASEHMENTSENLEDNWSNIILSHGLSKIVIYIVYAVTEGFLYSF